MARTASSFLSRDRPRTRRQRERRRLLLFTLPWIMGFLLIHAIPMVMAFGLSLTDWVFTDAPSWRGIDHYQTLVGDDLFWTALRNSAYYAGVTVPGGVIIALGLALLLNRDWAGMGMFRTILFMPALVSGVSIAMVWGWLFNPRFGAVNSALRRIGLEGPGWLGDPSWAMPVLISLGLWSIGGTMLIYLAGLQSIPQELYDAAKLDGAGRWAATRHVTLPMISSVTFFLLVVGMITALQLFTPAYVLTNGGPENATLTLPLYIYQNAFTFQKFGYGATLTVVLILLTMIITLAQVTLARRWVFYAGWGGR
ncbi:MAG: sugar ABC transporter permease [Thermomicrobiales bacterium]